MSSAEPFRPEPDPDREPLHHRAIDMRGYRRRDGLFEVEATLTDTKAVPKSWTRPDGVLHRMRIRVVFDEAMQVLDIDAGSEVTPYPACPQAAAALASLRGLSMASGWNRAIRERVGGVLGCTHLLELLGSIATTAFQTTSELRMAAPDRLDASGRPVKIDSCLAYSRHGEIVLERWPAHHVPPPAADGGR